MYCSCLKSFSLTKLPALAKMVFAQLTHYKVVRHLTTISIIALIIISVYYLNSTLEFLKKLIDHIDDADQAYAKHAARNITISKMIIEPLQRQAHDMYQKHEPATIMNIVTFATLIALSIVGLAATIKKYPSFLIMYGVGLDVIYASSFLYVSRIKPSICAFVVLVSILAFLHARQLLIQQSEKKLSILQGNSDRELIKERDYKYEHTSEVV